jgi:YgiT-type zinc finger domain-containing protein
MKCPICRNGSTQAGYASVILERAGVTLVFKCVPAQVCDNCGEEYIDEGVTRGLLDQAEQAVKQGVQLDVRQYRAA